MKLVSQQGGSRIYETADGGHVEVRAQSVRVEATMSADIIGGYPEIIRTVRSTLLKSLDEKMIAVGAFDVHNNIVLGNDEPREVYDIDGASVGTTVTFWAERGYWPAAPEEED